MGKKASGRRSNEFGYVNYEIIPAAAELSALTYQCSPLSPGRHHPMADPTVRRPETIKKLLSIAARAGIVFRLTGETSGVWTEKILYTF